MCFSFDGWALSVGHEHALTIWSTEDGTRLMCTLSDTGRRRRNDGHTSPAHGPATSTAAAGNGHCRPKGFTGAEALGMQPKSSNGQVRAVNTSGAADNGTSRGAEGTGDDGDGGESSEWGQGEEAVPNAGGMLDLVAGGARSLTWESEGYRLLSVGSAVGDEGTGQEGDTGVGKPKPQGIAAFDFLRRARSNLSSALLSLQGSDRIALVDSQPWSAQVLLWRVLPVRHGVLSLTNCTPSVFMIILVIVFLFFAVVFLLTGGLFSAFSLVDDWHRSHSWKGACPMVEIHVDLTPDDRPDDSLVSV